MSSREHVEASAGRKKENPGNSQDHFHSSARDHVLRATSLVYRWPF